MAADGSKLTLNLATITWGVQESTDNSEALLRNFPGYIGNPR
jgi:hypothetical protein